MNVNSAKRRRLLSVLRPHPSSLIPHPLIRPSALIPRTDRVRRAFRTADVGVARAPRGLDDAAAETDLALVDHDGLSRRDGPLRLGEIDHAAPVRDADDRAR